MTRKLAQDALRYVSHCYADDAAHNRKMIKRYGDDWQRAKLVAIGVYTAYGLIECRAVLEDMIYRAIDGRDKT